MKKKPTILLIWWYERKDFMEVLKKLKDDYNVILLYYFSKSHEKLDQFPDYGLESVYWNDFTSAQHLIQTVKPHTIIFMGLSSLLPMTLNIVAKSRNIPTILLEHGLRDFQNSIRRDLAGTRSKEQKGEEHHKIYSQNKKRNLQFLINSIRPNNFLSVLKLGKFLFLKRSLPEFLALSKVKFKSRRPTFYFVPSTYYIEQYKFLDGAVPTEFKFIGNLFLDDVIKSINIKEKKNLNYFLLIDQPLNKPMEESKKLFLSNLNEFALNNKCKLLIKLHPRSYNAPPLIEHENIEYLKHVDDIARLMVESTKCYGFFSTLILPIIGNKEVAILSFEDFAYINRWSELRMIENQSIENPVFTLGELNYKENFETFWNEFIYTKAGESFLIFEKELSEVVKND